MGLMPLTMQFAPISWEIVHIQSLQSTFSQLNILISVSRHVIRYYLSHCLPSYHLFEAGTITQHPVGTSDTRDTLL